MSTSREVLIVFTRSPEAGRVKTRLIPALGAHGAAALQRLLITDTLQRARTVARQRQLALEVWFDGADEGSLAACCGDGLVYRRQIGDDLGERMLHAFESALPSGDQRALLIGTDSPDLSADVLHTAFDALAACDLVLGPAHDGGYCLIGLRRAIPELFRTVAWGTPTVRERTLAIARGLALEVAELPVLDDIDRPEDLRRLPTRFAVAVEDLLRDARRN